MRIKRTKSVVAAVGLGATLAIAGAAQAQASAYGTSGFGWVTYNGVGMSRGVYNVYMSGSGNYVNYVKGGPIMTTPVSGTICNWNITAEFFDSYGRWTGTINGPYHATCNSYFNQPYADVIPIYSYKASGTMCSTLKSNGARLTSVCHSIHP